MKMMNSFPDSVKQSIKFYVYRLIDPRNGETFYVGKGKDNRVFSHVRMEAGLEGDELSNKSQRIRQIQEADLEVGHVIHRHGMDAKTAVEVEAALIDAYSGLTNCNCGVGSDDYGVMHVREIKAKYAAEPAVFKHKALLINVNQSANERSLYDAVRYAWKIDVKRARKADVVLAVKYGLIVGAFVADEWMPMTEANFPGCQSCTDRYGFKGGPASEKISQLYCRKRVPDQYRKRGAANPIRYTWK